MIYCADTFVMSSVEGGCGEKLESAMWVSKGKRGGPFLEAVIGSNL